MNSGIDYLNNPWAPAKQTIIKDPELRGCIETEGFAVRQIIDASQLESLIGLYNDLHNITTDDGGMFYSVYSQDIGYRKRIHVEIGRILKPTFEEHFHDYRTMLNSFVVKAPGANSEFYLHQDTTGLDEWHFSPLSIWIPLDDVNEHNGCLGIVPRSHRFFSPYRSISFPAPFDQISSDVKRFIIPVEMKKGEALIFDNRLVHNSSQNLSGTTRTAVVCGLFPKDAKLITCHKPEYSLGGKVELIEHDDSFLLEHPNFLVDCQLRPNTGTSIGWVDDEYRAISAIQFQAICAKFGISPNSNNEQILQIKCQLIAEPR